MAGSQAKSTRGIRHRRLKCMCCGQRLSNPEQYIHCYACEERTCHSCVAVVKDQRICLNCKDELNKPNG
jgi:hypothetical protein